MATEIKVPTLGESVTTATVARWMKQPGEAVAADEPIVSLETDKVAVEVPSPVAGVMGQQLVKEGDTVLVGAVLQGLEGADHLAELNPDLEVVEGGLEGLDGGAQHFVDCIRETRAASPATRIEVLVPDFRGRDDRALEILKAAPPDVMNHNMETVPRLYKEARPGSDYAFSLNLLKKFKALFPNVPTKSGLMVGLGETDEEILQVMQDMRDHNIDMLTIGQYLAPSTSHIPVRRYVHPDTFKMFEAKAYEMGFSHAAVGAMVRSSYHADQQAHAASEAAKA